MGARGSFFRAGVLGALLATMMLGLSQFPASGVTQEERPDATCFELFDTTFTVGTENARTPAQTFTAENTGRLTTSKMYVGDISDVGNLVVEIRAVEDASGAPTDVVLASASVPASVIQNSPGAGGENTIVAETAASFGPGAEVVAGRQYAIVLSASAGGAFVWASSGLNPCPGQAYSGSDGGSFDPQSSFDNTFSAYVTPRPDTTAPRVNSVVPAENATGSQGANVSASFSEAMSADSINSSTLKLFKKRSTTPIGAAVSYDASTEEAVLNPNVNLKRGKYKAVVTTGAQDLAGNQLDQDPTLSGNQPKEWFFTVRK